MRGSSGVARASGPRACSAAGCAPPWGLCRGAVRGGPLFSKRMPLGLPIARRLAGAPGLWHTPWPSWGGQAAACAYGAYGMLLLICLEGELKNFEEACAGGAGAVRRA